MEISPDADRCGVCGANLRRMITAQHASRYFYHRAADLSAKGQVAAALQEAKRGLRYQPSSELHLLAAILCKRQGNLDDMRHHVAAVPVDDVLRGEAEWLLRSHQARQRVRPRSGSTNALEEAPPPDEELLPLLVDEVRPSAGRAPQRSRGPGIITSVALAALVLVIGWIFWQAPPVWLAGILPAETVAQPAASERDGPGTGALEVETSVAAPAAQEENAASATTATPTLNLPTPSPLPNLAANTSTPQPLAGSAADAVVQAADTPALDWQTFLRKQGAEELAGLPVQARLEGDTLVLEGTVPFAVLRGELDEIGRLVPGVTTVSTVNVRLRPPETYTVRAGDTLWGISTEIYGTPDRIQDIYAANRDVLPSANALSVGMVLKLPPVTE
ncbi:MAG: LysM peptidoglycan-binding domain-containing protein [Caldilineaceae bacterium]|nr:LysM peptidoglycan-binding domain-containing protein [Caldilineaceae bacterium]